MNEVLPYMNRELSWLKFNERVLEEAEDETVPLCERLTFASIFQTNLDEFFRVRVGALWDQMLVEPFARDNKTNMTSEEQIAAILKQVCTLNTRRDYVYQKLMAKLEQKGVKLVNFNMLSMEESEYLKQYFDREIAPLISPMLLGKNAPFPFLKNGEIYAAILLESKSGKQKIGIVPCTNTVFCRLIKSPYREGTYMLSEELILHFVSKVYQKYTVKSKTLLRLVRNADIDADSLYDEDMDYRDLMVELIKRRKKLNPMYLALSREVDAVVLDTLCRNLGLSKERVFTGTTPLDLGFVFQIQDDLRKEEELFFPKMLPQNPSAFVGGESILEQIRTRDRMLAFPFESMKPFIEMLREAASDSEVLSIKMTLYRVAKNSKIVEALVDAAENGKEVIVLVELRARFDEENNIEWSRHLERAGCRVIYGLEGYKVHSKICLITRKEKDKVSYISQIGTGNYNEKTATMYTDLMVMTADINIGLELSSIFQSLSLGEVVEETKELLVAPKCLQNKVIASIDGEIEKANAGEAGYVGLKLNSLTDKKIMDKLIEASMAGVQIEMVVRGICCLKAGVPGYTENIKIASIVGRFLEHSRIYIFGKGTQKRIYIGSADFMTRNTLRRVEVAVPIQDEDIRLRIEEMFITMLADNVKARWMQPDGTYIRASREGEGLNSQEFFSNGCKWK